MESRWQKLKSRLMGLLPVIKKVGSTITSNLNYVIYGLFGIIIIILFLKIASLEKQLDESSLETANLLNESYKIDDSYFKKLQEIDKKYEQEINQINKNYRESKIELEKLKELKQKQIIKASYKQPDKVAKEIADEFDFDLVNSKNVSREGK